MLADLLVRNVREAATTQGASAAPLAGPALASTDVVSDAALASHDGRIVAFGPLREVMAGIELTPNAEIIDGGGRVMVPGLVDPHTHLLFAGSREDEFSMRAAGKSYMEIMQSGGGLYRTVRETRRATADDLYDHGRRMLAMMMRQGSTTVEIKSGYGLSTESETAMLECIDALGRAGPSTVVATFLGAHAIPEEYAGRADAYVDLVISEMLPAIRDAGLARYCDIFCEEGVLDVDQSRAVLEAATALGFELKVHGNELGHSGGVGLAASLDAVSVDHCNFLTDREIADLLQSETMAVGLPGTPFFRLAPRYADGRRIADSGVPLALATDFNPTASVSSMVLVMFLACLEMGLTPVEVFNASTINAAHAIGLAHRVGSLEEDKACDLLLLDVDDFRHIPFHAGRDLVDLVISNGRVMCGKRLEAHRFP